MFLWSSRNWEAMMGCSSSILWFFRQHSREHLVCDKCPLDVDFMFVLMIIFVMAKIYWYFLIYLEKYLFLAQTFKNVFRL
jgi:hypothetical protein